MTDDPGSGGATPPATTAKPDATSGATPAGATPPEPNDKGDGSLGDPGVRALAAERERVKALEATIGEQRAKLAELEDAGKSEVERTRSQLEREIQRANQAEARVADLERDRTRLRLAEEVGLPLELADRITGEDDRAMRADAKRLLDLTQPPDGRLGAGRGGVTPTRGTEDMNTLIRQASGR